MSAARPKGNGAGRQNKGCTKRGDNAWVKCSRDDEMETDLNLKTAVQAPYARAGAHAREGKTFSPPSLNG